MLAVRMLGIVDDEGIPCLTCGGQLMIGDEDCPDCRGKTGEPMGRIVPSEEDYDAICGRPDYEAAIQMVWNMRERPHPNELLALPAVAQGAFNFLSTYFDELDRRLKAGHEGPHCSGDGPA